MEQVLWESMVCMGCVVALACVQVDKSLATMALLGIGSLSGKRPCSLLSLEKSQCELARRMLSGGAVVTREFGGLRWRDVDFYQWVEPGEAGRVPVAANGYFDFQKGT